MVRPHRHFFRRIAPAFLAILLLASLASCHRYEPLSDNDKRDKAVLIWSDAEEKYEKNGEYERAIAEYQRALSISPRPAILYHLGHCYAQMGDYDRARNYLRQAIEMKPGYQLAEVELTRVNNLDPEGARRAGIPKPILRDTAATLPEVDDRDAQLKTARDTTPVAAPSARATRRPVLLVDDGSEAPAPTIEGTVPQQLPAPPELRKVAQAGPSAPPSLLPTVGPKDVPSRENDVKPTPVLQRVPEPRETPLPIVKPLATPAPRPTDELPDVIVTRPRATATPVLVAQLPTLKPTKRPTLPPTPTFAPPTPTPVPPTPTPVPPTPIPPEPTPVPTPRVIVSVPTATATPQLPSIEDVQKTLFPTPTPSLGAERPAPVYRPTPTGATKSGPGASLNSFAYHYEQGDKFLEHKEYARAISELQKALVFDERHLEGLLKLGDAYKKAGRTQQALNEYQKAVTYHGNEPRAYLKIGNLYINDKNPDNRRLARQAYQRATKVDPQYKQAYNNLGILDMKDNQIDSAIAHFQRVIEIDNDYPNAHLNLGILYEEYKRNNLRAYKHYSEYVRLGGRRSDEVRQWIQEMEKNR